MTLAFDAFSESSSDDPSFTHTPVGTPVAAIVFVMANDATSAAVNTVTYGGSAMTEVPLSPSLKATGEVSGVHAFLLGSSVPSGQQTVAVDTTVGAAAYHTVCVTVTGSANVEVDDTSVFTSDAQDDPSVTLQTTASTNTFIVAGLHSGVASPGSITAGSGYTAIGAGADQGSSSTFIIRKTDNGTGGDIAVLFTTAGGGDDANILAVALKEAGGAVQLVIADATHAHAADNLALTQHNVLAIQDATHGHTADNVVLGINLIIEDATHGHTADNLGLTQHHVLAIQDASHGHAADNLALTQHNVLAIADASHGHTADNLALTQHNILTVADALHAHAADNLVLTAHEPGGSLEIQDAAHAHAADNLVLGVGLVIADALHGHAADNLVLTQHNVLAIDDALHAHTADNLGLSVEGEESEQNVVRLRRRKAPLGTG